MPPNTLPPRILAPHVDNLKSKPGSGSKPEPQGRAKDHRKEANPDSENSQIWTWLSVTAWFSWMLYMAIAFVSAVLFFWAWIRRRLYSDKASAVRRVEWPKLAAREADNSRLVIVRGMMMSTPVDPSGLVPMPWEHCAAAIESGDNSDRNGGVIIARISCTGSAHDRACELFAYLTGTQVDYGEEHAAEHGHPRFGRVYEQAAHPTWGPDAPIHLLGHSAGGIAVVVFQEMVHTGYFKVCQDGEWVPTDASWLRSVVTLQAPLKGTPGAEVFNAKYTDNGVELPRFTMAHAISVFVLMYDKCAPTWMRRVFEVESPFSAEWSGRSLGDCLSHTGTYLNGRDTTLWELSPNYAETVLRHVQRHPSVYYISLATQCTHTASNAEGLEVVPDATMFVLLKMVSSFIGRHWNAADMDQRHNDGLVPIDSQRAPPGHPWMRLEGGRADWDLTSPRSSTAEAKSLNFTLNGREGNRTGNDKAALRERVLQRGEVKIPRGIWQVWHGRGDHLYYMFCPRRLQFYTSFYDQLFTFLKSLP